MKALGTLNKKVPRKSSLQILQNNNLVRIVRPISREIFVLFFALSRRQTHTKSPKKRIDIFGPRKRCL